MTWVDLGQRAADRSSSGDRYGRELIGAQNRVMRAKLASDGRGNQFLGNLSHPFHQDNDPNRVPRFQKAPFGLISRIWVVQGILWIQNILLIAEERFEDAKRLKKKLKQATVRFAPKV